jgi:hypothetical protein
LELTDFSPPLLPTPEQQCDALRKGLGRVALWAKSGLLDSQPLLDACLHDLRFDIQCEDNRGEWLWSLIQATNNAAAFRQPLLNALQSASLEWDAYQLCELAYHFAKSGDRDFRNQLYSFVERAPIADHPNIGMGQLVSLDKEEGLKFLLKHRGRKLLNEDWEWYDDSLIDQAIDVIGEQQVNTILSDTSDAAIARFAVKRKENLRQPEDPELLRTRHVEKMKAVSVREIFEAVHSDDRAYWLRGWGMQARDDELEQVFAALWTEQDWEVIVKLLRIFSGRSIPAFDTRLIELCRHPEYKVRFGASRVCEQNTHPAIRAFAWQELQEQALEIPVVGLFIRNFETGDEQRLLELIRLPDDLNFRHWMLSDLVHVLEENQQADCRELALIAYFHNPCSYCRYHAAELLRDRQAAPQWLIDECRWDANEETREVFGMDE